MNERNKVHTNQMQIKTTTTSTTNRKQWKTHRITDRPKSRNMQGFQMQKSKSGSADETLCKK